MNDGIVGPEVREMNIGVGKWVHFAMESQLGEGLLQYGCYSFYVYSCTHLIATEHNIRGGGVGMGAQLVQPVSVDSHGSHEQRTNHQLAIT